ncbi:hypothetical protein Lesp02_01920 [Lentzea sp. NBRC 105346]|uniref:hypothetical protein n=1 Tax=Lentzea sp. NBRC 105346 TaxID=3032205 RepID=UPI0024A54BE6|nr:hypothetical protein [Lentzea sp. NBRC 105346]GLZ28002.1 hypothetical protein Lesp02_01920 [Lentzea sp. NBRC 105346]
MLHQLHNDNAATGAQDDHDLANGTPTLLQAHAIESGHHTARALGLRAATRTDLDARAALRALLREPAAFEGYRQRVMPLHGGARRLPAALAAPSKYRRMLRIRLDMSAACAVRDREAPA